MRQILRLDTLEDIDQFVLDIHRPIRKWTSSAQTLDQSLIQAGYNIETRFFHPYKLPLTKEELELNVLQLWGQLFWETHIKSDQRQVYLSPRLQRTLVNETPVLIDKLNRLTQVIKENNPDLKNISTVSPLDQIHFLRGAAYGYSPESITFFINNYQNKQKLSETLLINQKLKKEFNIDAGFLRLDEDQLNNLVTQLLAQSTRRDRLRHAIDRLNLRPSPVPDKLMQLDPTGALAFMQEKEFD